MNNSFIFQPNTSNNTNGNQNKSIFIRFEDNEKVKLNLILLFGIGNSLKIGNISKFDITIN
eukprot:jgi/Orpsp1_1/1176764/evm.model.c7180000058911.1